MNKIRDAFNNKKAFIPFISVGDPDIKTSENIIYALEEAGCDLIELGIPFSDPTAEGPVIMRASERALLNKITSDDVFELVKKVRKTCQIPLAIMTYANVIYSYGIEEFAKKAHEVKIDALILADVPFEEKDEFEKIFLSYDIYLISMIAPTSKDRVEMIAKNAKGFLYCVSSLGVTGVRNDFSDNLESLIKTVKKVNPDLPCAIGFGISSSKQTRRFKKFSDGVIIGSEIVKIIEKYGRNSSTEVKKFAIDIKNSISNL